MITIEQALAKFRELEGTRRQIRSITDGPPERESVYGAVTDAWYILYYPHPEGTCVLDGDKTMVISKETGEVMGGN